MTHHPSVKVILEQRKFWLTAKLGTDFGIDNVQDAITYNLAMEDCVYRLRAIVYGRDIDKVVIEWPADWFQHFKQRWFPKFLLKKYPVVMASKTITATEYYPKVTAPKNSPVVRLYTLDKIPDECPTPCN
jgi:hypothetical protein